MAFRKADIRCGAEIGERKICTRYPMADLPFIYFYAGVALCSLFFVVPISEHSRVPRGLLWGVFALSTIPRYAGKVLKVTPQLPTFSGAVNGDHPLVLRVDDMYT